MSNFYGGTFFGGGFFGEIGEVVTPTIVIPGGVKRKRRILPDGRQILATEQEAIDTLLLYYHEQKLKPKESAVLGLEHNRKKKVIILPSERIEILEALETLRVEAELKLKRRKEEDEWLMLLN